MTRIAPSPMSYLDITPYTRHIVSACQEDVRPKLGTHVGRIDDEKSSELASIFRPICLRVSVSLNVGQRSYESFWNIM